MQAAVTTEDRRVEIVDRDGPRAGAGQIVLDVETSGICGSDLHVLAEFEAGIVMGHEFVGRVASIGPDVEEFAVGDRVVSLPVRACKSCRFCLSGDPINCPQADYLGGEGAPGSFAERVLVDAQASVLVPDSVSSDQAALTEPMSIALKIFEKAAVRAGEVLLVMGGGPIGLGVTIWAQAGGVGTIVVSDPVASRRELALRLGATHVIDPKAEDLPAYFDGEFGSGPDVVIECAGRPGTFAQANDVVVREGRVVIAGMHLKSEEFVRLTPFLKNLTVHFCCWYTTRHFAHTISMLEAGRIDPSPMITHRVPLPQIDAILQSLKTPNEFGKVLVTR